MAKTYHAVQRESEILIQIAWFVMLWISPLGESCAGNLCTLMTVRIFCAYYSISQGFIISYFIIHTYWYCFLSKKKCSIYITATCHWCGGKQFWNTAQEYMCEWEINAFPYVPSNFGVVFSVIKNGSGTITKSPTQTDLQLLHNIYTFLKVPCR